MKSAAFEAEPEPDEPFDYDAKPTTFYLEAEGTGALPVRDVITYVRFRPPAICSTTNTRSVGLRGFRDDARPIDHRVTETV